MAIGPANNLYSNLYHILYHNLNSILYPRRSVSISVLFLSYFVSASFEQAACITNDLQIE